VPPRLKNRTKHEKTKNKTKRRKGKQKQNKKPFFIDDPTPRAAPITSLFNEEGVMRAALFFMAWQI
jgi:hypothetical protein